MTRPTIATPGRRSTLEWIGKTPDSDPPPKVRERVHTRYDGQCHKCPRRVRPGERWTCEHLVAIINGGENRETNLRITCSACLPVKNKEDAALKTRIGNIRKRHLGIAKAKRPFPKHRDPWNKAWRAKLAEKDMERRDGR